jgi:two-component system OmpR family sensor kinase/two-component system sensor histidine kinase BaeS
MNRLWVRLSTAFSAVILLGVFLNILATVGITQTGALQVLVVGDIQRPGGLLEQIEGYYAEGNGWNAAGTALGETLRSYDAPVGFFLAVTDLNGRQIYAPEHMPRGTDGERIETLPIVANDVTVGYLIIAYHRPPTDPRFLDRLSTLLAMTALLGGVLGIISGAWMSHSLTAPLNRLAEAARAIGRRKLNQRVEVDGSREITEVASAFNEMAAALQEAETLRSNMVADVAHELRTPLSVLQGNLRAMLDDVYPSSKEELTRLYDQTRLLSRLVTDLHELSQAEAHQLPLYIQSIDLTELTRKVVNAFLPLGESGGVQINLLLPPTPLTIQGDSVRLTQVAHNLLDNALRHTPPGGCVEVILHCEATGVKLVVRDTGDGIPPEHLPHVFERFYRADRARSRATGGTGLGLAITRAIVEEHGGVITVASAGKPGEGSKFTVWLPTQS